MGLTQCTLLCHFRPFSSFHNDVLVGYLSRVVSASHQTAYSSLSMDHMTRVFRSECSWERAPASYSCQHINIMK
jgi:hypothetical protein